MWNNLSNFVLRYRLFLLLLIVVITGFMGWKAAHVQLAFNAGKVLPKDDPAYIRYDQFRKQFGEDGSVLAIGIKSPKIFDKDIYNDWIRLADSIKKLDGIQQIISTGKIFVLAKDTLNKKFELKPLFKGYVKSDVQMDSLKKAIYDLPFYDGLLYNKKENATVMAITFESRVLNTPARIPVINKINEEATAFGKKHNIDVHISGLPYIRTVISKLVSEEFALFLGLSLGIAALILIFFFRSFYAMFFPVVVVIIGVVWSLATLVLFGYKITLLTGLIPPLIVIIGIPNSILILNKYHNEYKKTGDKLLALKHVIGQIGITTFLANFTTAIGFGVLYFTNSEILMEFGAVAAINVMATWLICLFLIPIIFSYLPAPNVKHLRHLENSFLQKILKGIDYLVHKQRKLIYLLTIIVLGISFYGVSKIEINGYIVDDLPKNDLIYRDLKFFEHNFKGVLPLEISVDTKRKNGLMNLAVINKIERLTKMMETYPAFSRSVSLNEVLKYSTQAFYGGNSEFYRIPSDMEKNFILSYAANSGGKIKGSGNNMLKNFLDKDKQSTRISFQMADVGSERMNLMIKEIQPRIDSIFNPKNFNVELTGSSIIFIKGTNYLVKNLQDSLLLALALIAVLMWVMFRGFKMILISIIPNLIPLIITAGIMGYFGINLKPSTILIFSIALGIATDQTLYFLTRYRHELKNTNHSVSSIITSTLKETGVSMIYVALILFFGFGIFAASTFGGTVSLGILLSITLLFALICNLVLLPAFLLSLERSLANKKETHIPLDDVQPLDEVEPLS